MLRWSGALLTLTILAGCDGDAAPPADAGTDAGDAGASRAPLPPAPPSPPEPPLPPTPVSLLPCPAGWTEVAPRAELGATTCSPGAAPFTACGLGTARFPGEETCTTLAPCAELDGFPADAPTAGDVRFVRVGATSGDGSRGAPFAALADAVVGALAGTTIVLSAGTHDAGVAIPSGVTVVGVCPAQTLLTGPTDAPALDVIGSDVVLDRLSVRGSAVALSVGAGARVEVRASELVGEVIVDGDVSVIEASLRDGGLVVGATGALAGDRLSTTSAPLTVSGGTLELAHAAMIGGDFAVAVESGGSGLLRESVVAGQTDHGIAARGADAELTATDVVITDVRDTMGGGSGVVLDDGAVFRASRLAIIRPGAVAFDVVGSEVDLRGVALIDSGIDTAANMGGGMYVTGGSHVEAVALSAESSRSVGIILFQSSGYFEDLVVLDTASVGTALDGGGFIVASSHVAVERGWIAGSALGGVMVSDPQAQLRLEDVHILDTRSASGSFGRGLSAQTGAKVTLRRVAIEDATADGIFAVRRGASVTGTDVTIRRTRAARAGPLVGIGMGIHVQSGAFVDLKRVEVVESVGFGVVLVYDGSRGRLRDLVVRDTRSWERPALGDSLWGRGIDLQSGAHLTLERAIVSNNRDVGIGLSEDCELVLADVVVRDTQDEGVLGHGGRGLAVYYPSVVRGARVLLERNKEAGLVAFAAGTQIELTDLEIRDTMEATCVATGCPAGGIGLGAYEESDVSIRRFIIADSALLGVQVAELGGLDLESGTVSGSPVGASVDVAGYDIGRLSNDVRYENNGTNLDSAALPVPIRGPTFESEGEM